MLKVISPHYLLPPTSPHCRSLGQLYCSSVTRGMCGEQRCWVYPSGDTTTTQPKDTYFTMERSGTKNSFQRRRPLIFAKQLDSPCLAAEQRVWLMKRCQNDSPYYQKTMDRIFFYCLGKLEGGGKSEKRIREQKGNKEKVLKGENGNYIYICI